MRNTYQSKSAWNDRTLFISSYISFISDSLSQPPCNFPDERIHPLLRLNEDSVNRLKSCSAGKISFSSDGDISFREKPIRARNSDKQMDDGLPIANGAKVGLSRYEDDNLILTSFFLCDPHLLQGRATCMRGRANGGEQMLSKGGIDSS